MTWIGKDLSLVALIRLNLCHTLGASGSHKAPWLQAEEEVLELGTKQEEKIARH